MRHSPYQLDQSAALAAGAVKRGNELRLPCPVHDSSPETLALREGRVGPIWHCHAGCEPREVRDALLTEGILVRRIGSRVPRIRDSRTPPSWIPRAWRDAVPIAGTPAAAYLHSRSLHPPWPPQLRWDDSRGRMLARVAIGDRLCGLHATFLPGRERRTYGPLRGGAVRLAATDAGVLAVAEGIETALAYALLTETPTWAALSSAGLARIVLPDALDRLVIAADFDGAGLLAAERLERRARELGIDVEIDLPERRRTDWADVLEARSTARQQTPVFRGDKP